MSPVIIARVTTVDDFSAGFSEVGKDKGFQVRLELRV
jgi:hypothetical protein